VAVQYAGQDGTEFHLDLHYVLRIKILSRMPISKVVVGRYEVYGIYVYGISSWKNVQQKNSSSSELFVGLDTYATEK
jgi:hypothetical protein